MRERSITCLLPGHRLPVPRVQTFDKRMIAHVPTTNSSPSTTNSSRQPPLIPPTPMAPPPWATPEQLSFLAGEDAERVLAKVGSGTLRGFYSRTALAFLERWPVPPSTKILETAGGDEEKAKILVEEEMTHVSCTQSFLFFTRSSDFTACS